MSNKKKILYITEAPLETTFSGTAKYIRDGFVENGFEVIECISPLPILKNVNLKKSLYYRILKKIYIYKRDRKIIKKHFYNLNNKIENIEYDLIFSHFEWNLCYLNSDKPIFCWPDNFFTDFVNFYTKPWAKTSIRNGIEQSIAYYKKATATFYSSEWALNTAQNTEWVNSPTYFIPYGIGVEKNITDEELLRSKNKQNNNLQMVWIGLDAERKGLKKSIDIVKLLNLKGVNTTLNVIGINGKSSDNIRFYGKLSKKNKNELLLFQQILIEADLMLFLTKADCTPMVIGEALSYAVPVISHDVGGIASLMNEDCGKLFDLKATAEQISEWIVTYQQKPEKKEAMQEAALAFAHDKLSWKHSMARVCSLIQSHING
ncbi:glycosyltransferase family 4 protein [Algoriphagus formosus]|uniref:glycosyltransferase family 4 protein n=1 Tax=Algoriphagus formosus TaxID=2007308 RepID=UPI000C290130|nr:glycosyltransferase family 4 protein [Algoriphagus formosus]